MVANPQLGGNGLDGTVFNIVQRINSPVPIVPITRINDFRFNEELLKLDKYILCDYIEYGWDWDKSETHLFGKNTDKFSHIFSGDEWKKFDDFVAKNPPIVYFKRELLRKDTTDLLLPIEYPCWLDIPPVQTKEQFDARPINCFYSWGRSHESRLRLQGEIWINAYEKGGAVCDSLYYLAEFLKQDTNKSKWVALNIPHYARIDLGIILGYNGLSKTSISMPGAGVKCFRHSEAPINSVMVKWEDNLAWAFPWVHGVNAIETEPYSETIDIEWALDNENLYDIYLSGVENCRKYQLQNYLMHIESKIKERL